VFFVCRKMNVYLLFFLLVLLVLAAIYTALKFQWDDTEHGKASYLQPVTELVGCFFYFTFFFLLSQPIGSRPSCTV